MEPLEIGRNKKTIHNNPIIPKRRPVTSNRRILKIHTQKTNDWNEKEFDKDGIKRKSFKNLRFLGRMWKRSRRSRFLKV